MKTGSRSGWLVAVVAGLALGAANSLSSALGSAYQPSSIAPDVGVPALQYLAAWLGTRWAWALFAFFVGWWSRRLVPAVLRGLTGLLFAVLAYYLCDVALGVNDVLSVGEIGLWWVISLVVGPVMGAAGHLARRATRWGLVIALSAPGLMVVDTLWAPTGPDSIRPWAQWCVYAGAVVLGTVLVARGVRRSRADAPTGADPRTRSAGR
ncbi:MAG TPA: DUF6518 family protein [Propionibacteriaceae bacterium]